MKLFESFVGQTKGSFHYARDSISNEFPFKRQRKFIHKKRNENLPIFNVQYSFPTYYTNLSYYIINALAKIFFALSLNRNFNLTMSTKKSFFYYNFSLHFVKQYRT